ncbi:MAG: hypothetical protein Kow0081_1550 [Candidatus Dojkabacteria bacterium]
MKIIKGKNIIERKEILIPSNFVKTIIEFGSGDGKELYKLARENPKNFHIGIEPNEKALEKVTKQIYKKPAKGGLENIIFLKASVQQVDSSLFHSADEVFVSFPWGSLLEGIVKADPEVIFGIKNVLKNGAIASFTLAYDDKYEENYLKERQMPKLNLEFLETTFAAKLKEFGLTLKLARLMQDGEKKNIKSSWGKKILEKRDREVYEVILQNSGYN